MPTYTNTSKHSLRRLTGGSLISEIDTGIAALADDIDAIIATDDQGTFAARPVSTAGSPGKSGRYYYATDTGELFRDTGTAWVAVQVGLIANADLADGAVSVVKTGVGDSGLARGSFSAIRSGSYVTTANQPFLFEAEEWDYSSWYNPATGRFTPLLAGIYRLSASVYTGIAGQLAIRKNGAIHRERFVTDADSKELSALVQANGTTDYFTVTVSTATDLDPAASGGVVAGQYWFQGELVGRI